MVEDLELAVWSIFGGRKSKGDSMDSGRQPTFSQPSFSACIQCDDVFHCVLGSHSPRQDLARKLRVFI